MSELSSVQKEILHYLRATNKSLVISAQQPLGIQDVLRELVDSCIGSRITLYADRLLLVHDVDGKERVIKKPIDLLCTNLSTYSTDLLVVHGFKNEGTGWDTIIQDIISKSKRVIYREYPFSKEIDPRGFGWLFEDSTQQIVCGIRETRECQS